ncbi:MAG: 6-bladed beta-propeller [Tannerellaceae bacterium]|nr:6-bladed beta-propeller [Tannerellaceae bacterium]
MKTFYYLILFAFLILISGSCNEGNKKEDNSGSYLANAPVIAQKSIHKGEELVTADLSLLDKKDISNIPLSILLSSFDIIPLENSDEALTAPDGKIHVSENYMGIYSFRANAYKLYDKKGNYISTLSTPGQGPDEYYVGLVDGYIDEKQGLVYLLSFRASKLMIFDFEGKPQKHIPLAYLTHKARFIIDKEKETLLIMALPFADTPSVIWLQDFQGNVLQEIPAGQFTIIPSDYCNEVWESLNTDQTDFSIFYAVQKQDSLYHYDIKTNQLIPKFTIDFKNDFIEHFYIELPNHYLTWWYTQHSWGTVMPRFPKIIIEKESLKGLYVDFRFDMLGYIPGPNWISFSRGYFTAIMDPDDLKEQLEKALLKSDRLDPDVVKRMKDLNDNIGEDDNNIVFIGKLKTD